MIAINVTEFRGNVKKYLEAAEREKVIVHNAKGKAYAIVPVNEIKEPPFNLSEEQNKAIGKALLDEENNRVHSNEDVMLETKKRYPHLL